MGLTFQLVKWTEGIPPPSLPFVPAASRFKYRCTIRINTGSLLLLFMYFFIFISIFFLHTQARYLGTLYELRYEGADNSMYARGS